MYKLSCEPVDRLCSLFDVMKYIGLKWLIYTLLYNGVMCWKVDIYKLTTRSDCRTANQALTPATPPYLEDVFTGAYVCDVNPLAVDVVAIGIPATHRDALLTHVVAGKPLT